MFKCSICYKQGCQVIVKTKYQILSEKNTKFLTLFSKFQNFKYQTVNKNFREKIPNSK